MTRGRRRALTDAIKEQQERAKVAAEVDWTMQALTFLRSYGGQNPVLRSLARRAADPRWVPTEREVVQVHRLVHRERIEIQHPERDSMGNRLRRREGRDLPDSLEEPDWL